MVTTQQTAGIHSESCHGTFVAHVDNGGGTGLIPVGSTDNTYVITRRFDGAGRIEDDVTQHHTRIGCGDEASIIVLYVDSETADGVVLSVKDSRESLLVLT